MAAGLSAHAEKSRTRMTADSLAGHNLKIQLELILDLHRATGNADGLDAEIRLFQGGGTAVVMAFRPGICKGGLIGGLVDLSNHILVFADSTLISWHRPSPPTSSPDRSGRETAVEVAGDFL